MLNTWIWLAEVWNKTDGDRVNVRGCITVQLMAFANTAEGFKIEFRICYKVSSFLVPELFSRYIVKNASRKTKDWGSNPISDRISTASSVRFSGCWGFFLSLVVELTTYLHLVSSLRKAGSVSIVTGLDDPKFESRQE